MRFKSAFDRDYMSNASVPQTVAIGSAIITYLCRYGGAVLRTIL